MNHVEGQLTDESHLTDHNMTSQDDPANQSMRSEDFDLNECFRMDAVSFFHVNWSVLGYPMLFPLLVGL
jgi:hypothetical protein